MTHSSRHLVCALILMLTSSCGNGTPSQIMIGVSLGPGLDAESYDTTVTITSDHQDSPQSSTETVSRSAFPLCVAVVPFDDDASRTFNARVELSRGGVLVASREVETGFVDGEIRALALEMVPECIATNGCEPILRVEASSLPAFENGFCAGDAADTGARDAGPASDGASDGPADSGPEPCRAAPASPCEFADVIDSDAEPSLQRGFFAGESLILYGETAGVVRMSEVWPNDRTIGVYVASNPDDEPRALVAGGGASFDRRACIAISTESGSFTLSNAGATTLFEGSNNHLVLCDGDPELLSTNSGPTSGFALGPGADQPFYVLERPLAQWNLATSGESILGFSAGDVSDLLVRGDVSIGCASMSFSESWTTYNTNVDLRSLYTASGGQDASATCKNEGSTNPRQTYHFGGDGEEDVRALLVQPATVFALVRHTEQLSLGIGQGMATGISMEGGWTLLALSRTAISWNQTFSEESSAALLDGDLVVATTNAVDNSTSLSRYMTTGVVRESHIVDGLWSLVATDARPDSPQMLGLVSARGGSTARVIILAGL